MKKLTKLATLLALVAGLNSVAQADGGGGSGGPHTATPTLPSILVLLSGAFG
jgi:hypothetical protein